MYLGDFAVFYLVPMLLYVIVYTRIAITLHRANNMTTNNEQSPPSIPTCSDNRPIVKGQLSHQLVYDYVISVNIAVRSNSLRTPKPTTSNGNNRNGGGDQFVRDSFVTGGRRSSTKGSNQVLIMIICRIMYI